MNGLGSRPLALAIVLVVLGIVMAVVASGGADGESSIAQPETTALPGDPAPDSSAPTLFEEEGEPATSNDFVFFVVPLVLFGLLILVSVATRKRSRGPFG